MENNADEIKAIAILLFVIGLLRTLAILVSPGKKLKELKDEN